MFSSVAASRSPASIASIARSIVGRDIARSSSAAKLLSSKLATEVAGMAVQVCGAHGTRVSSPFGRYLRDAKTYEIGGGSSEMLKNTIAKSLIRSVRPPV
jgi:alkylation response protein AidB-like acyl-CoA dehydrogenase